ncbi:AraC family transcriptional regulator [Chryseobacterium shigense]|uniref:Transcriptional regulator, AraC family n=1 Tax=Chryseobacterium shigense TaxID=297244 RepID=A0A1N7HT13_9FLAO|nr:AraC family transcriptional regulator [Chryseobacterium shigense]PQA93053.1 AraC family transcriptional regulator [Chryseobacterium shigense]SIS27953.1 transcriptional regulator, AraC family [Chryseobacterium shigense]
MAKENIHHSLEVYYEKIDCCPLRDRQFNFFEFVYVLSGKGNHGINGNLLPFKAGDLFLITPNDYHSFDLDRVCEFMVVRFAPSYVKSYHWESIDHIECLLYYASHFSGSILTIEADKIMVANLMQNLQHTAELTSIYSEDLMRHLVNAIIVIAARNISVIKPESISPNADTRILQIIDYIQGNIRQPELLKIGVIAEKFGLSGTYLGSYFRKQCHESIQQYISSYRIRLIEHRLRFSDKRIHEIADEFGFADESHINKFFKRHRGLSLRVYRDNCKRENMQVS